MYSPRAELLLLRTLSLLYAFFYAYILGWIKTRGILGIATYYTGMALIGIALLYSLYLISYKVFVRTATPLVAIHIVLLILILY